MENANFCQPNSKNSSYFRGYFIPSMCVGSTKKAQNTKEMIKEKEPVNHFVIKRGLEEAIRECNRNIYEWMVKKKRGSIFTISHTEIRGLVKNWIIRRLKDIMGNVQADRVLREGNLYVSIDDTNNCIHSISLSSTEEWRSIHGDVEIVKSAMNDIVFTSLRYNPADYHMDDSKEAHCGNPSWISLSSIEKIKF